MKISISKGELVALMGPSGCGKTTLLNVLARRPAASGAKVLGDCYVNGGKVDVGSFGRMTSYVEQEDALIGSLTVRETLKFAADLSLPRYGPRLSSMLIIQCPCLSTWTNQVFTCDIARLPNANASIASGPSWKPSVSRTKQAPWSEPRFVRVSVVARNDGSV